MALTVSGAQTTSLYLCLCVLQQASHVAPAFGVPKSELFPYGPEHGDSQLPDRNHESVGPIPLSVPIPFLNESHTILYVHTNGYVAFGQDILGQSYSCPVREDHSEYREPMVLAYATPFDVMTCGRPSVIYYRETNSQTLRDRAMADIGRAFPELDSSVSSASLFITTWVDMDTRYRWCNYGTYNHATFQLVLSTDAVHSFALMYYHEVNYPPTGHDCPYFIPLAGLRSRTGLTTQQLPGSCTNDVAAQLTRTGNVAGDAEPGKWALRMDDGQTPPGPSPCEQAKQSLTAATALRISPSFVSAYGHEPITISGGPCLEDEDLAGEDVLCRFHDPLWAGDEHDQESQWHDVPAFLDRNESLVLCATPFLYTLGRLEIDVVVNRAQSRGRRQDDDHHEQEIYSGFVYVLEPDPQPPVVLTLTEPESDSDSDIVSVHLTWDPSSFPDDVLQLQVTMWEVSDDSNWKQVLTLGEIERRRVRRQDVSGSGSDSNNKLDELSDPGEFEAFVDASAVDSLVIFRLAPSKLFGEEEGKPAVHHPAILLLLRPAFFTAARALIKWYIKSGEACQTWHRLDPGLPGGGVPIQPCPCLESQASRDPRFKREETTLGHFHPGASSGFRQRAPSPTSGAGQQCTYDGEGNLLTRGTGAGSADRYSPDNVAGFMGHLVHDVLPWYLCRQGGPANLALYQARREADDCASYREPGLAGGRGDPHISTLDGASYTFNGVGEFWMIQSTEFGMQGRMEEMGKWNNASASVFTAFVAHDAETKVQLELRSGVLEIRLDDEIIALDDHDGDTPSSRFIPAASASIQISVDPSGSATTTVSFNIGFAFTVTMQTAVLGDDDDGRDRGSLGILALADDSRLNRADGLFGHYDGDPENDLLGPNPGSLPLPINSTLSRIHYEFGLLWMTSASESLFLYAPGFSHASYANPDFEPSFELPDPGQMPEQVLATCNGSLECMYDWTRTGSLGFAAATRDQGRVFNETGMALGEKLLLCPRIPAELENGFVNLTTNPVVGSVVRFECEPGHELHGCSDMRCELVETEPEVVPEPDWCCCPDPPSCERLDDVTTTTTTEADEEGPTSTPRTDQTTTTTDEPVSVSVTVTVTERAPTTTDGHGGEGAATANRAPMAVLAMLSLALIVSRLPFM